MTISTQQRPLPAGVIGLSQIERGLRPARLRPFVEELREVFPPITAPRLPGPDASRLQDRLTAKVFAGAIVGETA